MFSATDVNLSASKHACRTQFSCDILTPGPFLESKGMGTIFQKKGKKNMKNVKYSKIWAKIDKF